MLFLSKPSSEQIKHFLETQSAVQLTYSDIGATRNGEAPPGYYVDHNRLLLGRGEQIFYRAKHALAGWKMFHIPWVKLCREDAPIVDGTRVAVMARHFGFWSLNGCRIVYVLEEVNERYSRFGFAYGTLADHLESGEERFLVEWDRQNEIVSYDIFAFSRPHKMIAKLGIPIGRMLQDRFAQASMQAMAKAVLDAD